MKTPVKSGGLSKAGGSLTQPSRSPVPVTAPMPARKAKGFRRRKSAAISPRPARPSKVLASSVPKRTKVAGSATMKPMFFKPMKVRKTPMPAAAAVRRLSGMALATCSRNGVAETMRKSTPAQNTIPRAVGHGTLWPMTMV